MRLAEAAHTRHPWRIHELTPDFELEDVWELPGAQGPDHLRELAARMTRFDPAGIDSVVVRALFTARLAIGALLGLDRPDTGLGGRVRSLRERLADDLRDALPGPERPSVSFTPLYVLDDEWAAELANRTVHGVVHLSRVPDGAGRYRTRLAVYVKPNGRLGRAYLAAIRPFRRILVYPLLLRELASPRH